MVEALVEDVVTRWDSELAMLERVYYFDNEILELALDQTLDIPRDLILNRFELDLAYAMTLVLTPFRIFTKFVQNKSVVTLAYIPKKIDELISALAPGSFVARLAGRADGIVAHMEAFQLCLVQSLKERFSYLFEGESLALAARMFLPGTNLFDFENFDVGADVLAAVKENILSDFVELLPPGMLDARKVLQKSLANNTLDLARLTLDESPEEEDPLLWWPSHPEFSLLYPVAKMLLQIPAASAENERSFSSASFVLDQRRTRLDLDNFRREHRIRRTLCAGTTPEERLEICNSLMDRFAQRVEEERNQ